MTSFDTKTKILQEISAIDSQLDTSRVVSPFEHTVAHVEKAYRDLTKIHEQRERYNVNWAFSHASDTIQTLISRAFSRQLKDKIASYAGTFRNRRRKHTIEKRFAVIQRSLTEKVNKTRTSPRVFKTAAAVLLLAEMTFTVVIVLLVSRLAFYINRSISVPQLSILFLAIFGLMRLFLYKAKTRFLHNWSWGLYQDAVDTAFDGIAIIMATSFVLAYHVKRGIFLESKLDAILSRSLRQLQEPPSRVLRKQRRAQHHAGRIKSLELEKIERFRGRLEYQSLQEAFDLKKPGTRRKKGYFTAATSLGSIQVRAPKRQGILPQQQADAPLYPAEPEVPMNSELPSTESLLTPDAIQVLKKRTNKVMHYLSKKFSIHKPKNTDN